jgi:hypothetical protein
MLKNYALPWLKNSNSSSSNNNNLILQLDSQPVPFFSHCPWLFQYEFLKLMDRKRRTKCITPSFSWYYAFELFPVGLWKKRCTAKEWTCWVNLKHRSLQQLQMLQRTYYSSSGKRYTIGGEIQMVLTVKCFAHNNFSAYVKKVMQTEHKYLFYISTGRPCTVK